MNKYRAEKDHKFIRAPKKKNNYFRITYPKVHGYEQKLTDESESVIEFDALNDYMISINESDEDDTPTLAQRTRLNFEDSSPLVFDECKIRNPMNTLELSASKRFSMPFFST